MRLISLLLALAILGYVIKVYLDSSVNSETGEYTSRPQQTIEQAEDAAQQLGETLQLQQKRMEDAAQE